MSPETVHPTRSADRNSSFNVSNASVEDNPSEEKSGVEPNKVQPNLKLNR